MNNPPIPPRTFDNVCGALGDVMRASAAWGMADVKGEVTDQHIQLVSQMVAQCLALMFQREPTDAEMMRVIGG